MRKGTRVRVRPNVRSTFAGKLGTVSRIDHPGPSNLTHMVDLDDYPEWSGAEATPFSPNELEEVA